MNTATEFLDGMNRSIRVAQNVTNAVRTGCDELLSDSRRNLQNQQYQQYQNQPQYTQNIEYGYGYGPDNGYSSNQPVVSGYPGISDPTYGFDKTYTGGRF